MREGIDGALGELVARVQALRAAGATTVIVDQKPDGTYIRAVFGPPQATIPDEPPVDPADAKRAREELLEWSST